MDGLKTNNMKLAAIYTVYNGLELLKGSISQIEEHVDKIIIVFQTTSNRGEKNLNIFEELQRILDYKGYHPEKKYHFVSFEPDLSLSTKENELNKHNLGLRHARNYGCTHWFLSATDHYYDPKQFKFAKEEVIKNDYDVTLTSMYTYYKSPKWQITPKEDYFMPFICKIYRETKYVKAQWAFKVDPSVRVNTSKNAYLFYEEEIIMHHYSMIREDIENKFNNAAASSRWGDKAKIYLDEYNSATLESKLEYFGGRGLQEVPNYFNI